MNKFMMMVVLLAGYLWTDAANAQANWEMYQETDPMTGKTSEAYPIIWVNWANEFYPQVEFMCDESSAAFIITTLENTMPYVAYSSYYNNYHTQIRINWGDGEVQTYTPMRRDFANKFFLGIYAFDPTKIDPDNFIFELISDTGEKYHIGSGGVGSDGRATKERGDGYMRNYLLACKELGLRKEAEEKAAREAEKARKAEEFRKEQEQEAALSNYGHVLLKYFVDNLYVTKVPKKIGNREICKLFLQGRDPVKVGNINCFGDEYYTIYDRREEVMRKLVENMPQPEADIGYLIDYPITINLTEIAAAKGAKVK